MTAEFMSAWVDAPYADREGASFARALEHIKVSGIDEIEGFTELTELKSFKNFDGKFAPAWSELPASLTHFALPTPSLRKREKHYAEVRAHGLNPELHPDAHFPYK